MASISVAPPQLRRARARPRLSFLLSTLVRHSRKLRCDQEYFHHVGRRVVTFRRFSETNLLLLPRAFNAWGKYNFSCTRPTKSSVVCIWPAPAVCLPLLRNFLVYFVLRRSAPSPALSRPSKTATLSYPPSHLSLFLYPIL